MKFNEILALFPSAKPSASKPGQFVALCPAHKDKARSLAISSDNGKTLLNCFAGCEYEQILQAINLNPSDLFENHKDFHNSPKQTFSIAAPTIEELAAKKKIPLDFLASLGIRNANGAIQIDYLDANGEKTVRQRIRNGISAHSSKWANGEAPIAPYGLWLPLNQGANELIICEGESNCWTLWLHDFPAIGIPGANMFSKLEFSHVANAKKITILKDPDQGGEAMANGLPKHLKTIGWHGSINVITLPVKDVSDFYCQDTENFKEKFSKILAESDKLNDTTTETKAMPFPIDSLPPLFASYCKNIAANLSTSVDYSAISLLGLVSVLSGKATIYVAKKDWRSKAILYLALIGNPGSTKTPAMEKTMAALYEIEDGLKGENKSAIAEFKALQEQYKIACSLWKQESKKGNSIESPEPPNEPEQKTMLTTDATTESLAPILEGNDGVLILKDELSGWISSMDQYRAGKGADKEFYLSAWSGTFAKIDRKGKPAIFIKSPHISIIGGIVPDKLNLLNNSQNDGFFDRLLCCYPDVPTHVWETEGVDFITRGRAKDALLNIYKNRDNIDEIVVNPEGEKLFGEYYNESNAKIGDFWSKMPQHCLRIALCLCLLWEKSQCDAATMQKAIDISRYFESHNEKARGKSKETEAVKQKNAILDFAKRKGITRIKPRTLQVARVPGCDTAKSAKQQIQELVDLELAFWIVENKEAELC